MVDGNIGDALDVVGDRAWRKRAKVVSPATKTVPSHHEIGKKIRKRNEREAEEEGQGTTMNG